MSEYKLRNATHLDIVSALLTGRNVVTAHGIVNGYEELHGSFTLYKVGGGVIKPEGEKFPILHEGAKIYMHTPGRPVPKFDLPHMVSATVVQE